MEAIGFDAHMLHEILKKGKFSSSVVITFQVMAFAGMSPGHPNPISAFSKCRKEEFRAHPPGAGYSNDADIGRIFHTADSRQIGCSIGAPVA
jgi:hypothetical protein